MWFNYLPINDRSKTATITGYSFGNGAQGYASVQASGFIKTGSSSSYVLLGDGGHKTISSLSVNHASFADYIRRNTLPTPANNTVKAYKDSLVKFFTNYPNGIGANVSVSTSIINNWSNDAATYYDSSSYSVIKISGSYNGTTYGQFLLSSYNLSQVGIVGRNDNKWSKIKWLAFEDQIPTDNNQLANGAGYITSAGSCAYATRAGNADTVDGQHFSYSNSSNSPTYLWATNSNGSSFLAARASISVNYANSAGSASSATKLTSSAGSATLPIYFSDGKPVACTASSVFSNLSNSGNNLSITVAGQNRTLTVGYATSAGSATKVIVNQNTTNDANYPLVWSNQNNTNTVTENQLYKSWSDLYYNPKNKRLTVGGSVVASSFIKSGGTSQQLLRADGGIATFNWSGQSGQPTWLWGGNNEHSYYVYNPSNFRVAYSTSAGNADTLDGVHLSGIFTAFGNNGHNITATIGGTTKSFLVNWAADSDKLDGYHVSDLLTSVTNTNNGISVTVGGTTKSVSNISVNYANSAGSADTAQYLRSLGNQNCQTGRTQNYGDVYTYNTYTNNTGAPTSYTSVIGFGRGIAGTVEIAGGWNNTNLYWRSLRDCCEDWYSWRTVLDSSNYSEFVNNYYWANVKISTSSSTTTSPTVSTLTATSSIRIGSTLNIKDSVISCSASNISIESKESGSLLINSHEVLSYDLDRISMTNKTQFVHRLGLGASSPDPISHIHTTDDVTVYIGSLTKSSFFEFRPAMDGQLLFLKIGKLHSSTYFWCTARDCEVIRADNFSTYLNKNQTKDCFGDGCARIFIYKQITERWYEFYCG